MVTPLCSHFYPIRFGPPPPVAIETSWTPPPPATKLVSLELAAVLRLVA